MSDERREQGRTESAPAGASPTEQQPAPAFAGGPPPTGQIYPGQPQPQPSYGPGPAWGAGPGAPWGAGRPPAPPLGTPPGAPPPPPNGHPGTAYLEQSPRGGKGRTGIVVLALVAGLVGGGAAGAGTATLLTDRVDSSPTLSQAPSGASTTAAPVGSVAAAAAKAMPSTVDIQVRLPQGGAEGSGVILTADGNVLTNNHVVAGGQGTMTVTLADGSEHPATVVGTSPSYDLAVIKLQDVSGLTPAVLGQSSDLQVGQQVVAIGSPQGLTGTVTDGIVSALNRTVAVAGESASSAVVYNGLQTDAAINPGNSGGPLINLDGQVIGINSAIATADGSSGGQGGSIGLGFAIPVDQAKRVAEEIMKTGSATKPVLGVKGNVAGSSRGGPSTGAQISAVEAGSPAAAAGLVPGDVVTKVNTAKVEDFADLIARIGSYAPGTKVMLTVTSGGAPKTVEVTLGSQPDRAASTGTGGESSNPFGGGN